MLPKDVRVQTLLQHRDVLQRPLLRASFAVQLEGQGPRQDRRGEEVEVKVDSNWDEDREKEGMHK